MTFDRNLNSTRNWCQNIQCLLWAHYVGKALRRLSAWDPGCGGPSTPIRVGHPWAAARCAALVQRFILSWCWWNFWPQPIRSTEFGHVTSHGYRNWPRYGLRWSGWYCHQAQHELCRPSRGRLRPRRPAQRVLCLMAVPPTTAQTV